MKDLEDKRRYRVVMNDEDQYSIWPIEGDMPLGWQATGFVGDRVSCLSHIDEVWADMRPRSVREWLAVAS